MGCRAAISKSSADPVAAFTYGRVGQTYRVKLVLVALDAGNVYLDFNDAGIDTVHRGTGGLVKHVRDACVLARRDISGGEDEGWRANTLIHRAMKVCDDVTFRV